MRFRYTAAALAVMALGTAHADEEPRFKFSGYGTLAAVHSSERQADFTGGDNQPNGAGFTRSTSFNPDSKLAGQVNARIADKWSAVVQVVAQHQHDNSFTPQLEWANVRYQLTPGLGVRLGRIAAPAFMVSESRLVGYANPYARPPKEVYGSNPVTSNDGLDLTYRSTIAGANSTFQAYIGRAAIKLPDNASATSRPSWGFAESVDIGALTVRASYVSGKTSFDVASIKQLLGGLNQFAAGAGGVPLAPYQAAAAQANALAHEFRLEGIDGSTCAVGVNYDPGDWFVAAEFAAQRLAGGFVPDSDGWYAGAGYRFGSLTPYATYASRRSKSRPTPAISTTGLDPQTAGAAAALGGGLAAVVNAIAKRQTSVAVGLRWDFMTNVAVKGQFERISLRDNTAGLLSNVQPGFVRGGQVDVVSVAVDFVF